MIFKTKNMLTHMVLTLMLISPLTVFSQSFPNKPIKFIVTYPPGGSSDLIARTIGRKLNVLWGQPVILDYKAGAAGAIGMDFVAHQPADGYTFVVSVLEVCRIFLRNYS